MAGKRRTRTKKLSALTLKDSEGVYNRADDPPTNFDLPGEILELIFSQLNLRDNIRASAVCKNWLVVAASVRKPNKTPWLMLFPNSGAFYEFYDPSNCKRYVLEFPELLGARICHSKDGWLLLHRRRDSSVFFFHPYTRQLINLPQKDLADQVAAFSVAPTSNSCIVFTIRRIHGITLISTCHPGATVWTTYIFQNPLNCPIFGINWDKIIFCSGIFYCLSDYGWLGIFDPDIAFWSLCTGPPNFTACFPRNDWQRGRFLLEHDGDVYVIYTSPKSRPFIYKLNEVGEGWTEVGGLGHLTFFANSLSSIVRTDFHGKMRGSVYFSKVQFHGKKCVTYSPDAGRYYPRNEKYDWGKQDLGSSIWIDAPEELSVFTQRSAQTFKYSEGIYNQADDAPTNFDLPAEILELIFSQLNLGDNIRASAICKKWLCAASVREPNKAPRLMLFPSYVAFYEFYDLSNRKRSVKGDEGISNRTDDPPINFGLRTGILDLIIVGGSFALLERAQYSCF